jgi:hypothetical protein
MQHATGRSLAPAQKADAGKGGVALEIAGSGEEPQRPAPGVPLLLRVGPPVRHRRAALRRQFLRVEFEPARGGTEFLFAQRGERDRPPAAQRRRIDGGDAPTRAFEDPARDRRGRHPEHRVGDAHAPRRFLCQPEV